MSFTYDILTEEEAEKERRFKLLDPGVYPFTVSNAIAETSKASGNPMIKLLLSIYDSDGKEHLIYDYLVGTKNMAWKLRHFCESTELVHEYESGTFDEFKCIKRSGFANVSIQPEQNRNGKIYKEKNNIDDYVLDQQGAINHIKTDKKAVTMDDDDLPF